MKDEYENAKKLVENDPIWKDLEKTENLWPEFELVKENNVHYHETSWEHIFGEYLEMGKLWADLTETLKQDKEGHI